MRKELRKKRGSIEMSFGMIFSIILIIAFIALSIYVITVFLGWKKCAETGLFKKDFQDAIDKALYSDETHSTFPGVSAGLGNIEKICFIDFSTGARGIYGDYYDSFLKYEGNKVNMILYPPEKACKGQESYTINHINLTEITKDKNPYCLDTSKLKIKIDKGFYDSLVKLS